MESQDHFRERVQTLVAEGKLTPEEAAQLLGEAHRPGPSEVRLTKENPETETPRRLCIKLQGASVQVQADPTITSPRVLTHGEGTLELLSTPQGWLVRRERNEEHWLSRLTQQLLREGLRVDIHVPADFHEIDVDLQGGSVRLGDLPVRAHVNLQGGSLHATHVTALNANVTGGSVTATATLEEGEHPVKITGGSLNLTILNPHDVHLTARTVGGSIRTHGLAMKRTDTNPASAQYESYADGPAKLNVTITGGSASIQADNTEVRA